MKLIYRCICLVLGALLGAGCDSDDGTRVEYGQPHGTLRLDGHVQDEAGDPIAGIQVYHYGCEPDTTDAQGAWAIEDEFAQVPCSEGDSLRCAVVASDIDGAEGGQYKEALELLDLTRTEEGSGWYEGTFEQHDIDLVLELQKSRAPKDAADR